MKGLRPSTARIGFSQLRFLDVSILQMHSSVPNFVFLLSIIHVFRVTGDSLGVTVVLSVSIKGLQKYSFAVSCRWQSHSINFIFKDSLNVQKGEHKFIITTNTAMPNYSSVTRPNYYFLCAINLHLQTHTAHALTVYCATYTFRQITANILYKILLVHKFYCVPSATPISPRSFHKN